MVYMGVASSKWRHYMWLLLWWFCLYYAIVHNSMMASVAFLLLFFIASTYKTLFKSLVIGIVCALLVNIPFIPLIIFAIGIVGILFRFRFLAKHWRVLLVGLFAYGVHFAVLLFNGFIKGFHWILKTYSMANQEGVEVAQTISSGAMLMGVLIATILAFVLHRKIVWLYKHNYSTERAFLIMGLTPLIVIATIFPFLSHIKVGDYDLTGDSLLDADSISGAADSLSGLETGAMGAAAHGTNEAAAKQGREEERAESRERIESELDRLLRERKNQ